MSRFMRQGDGGRVQDTAGGDLWGGGADAPPNVSSGSGQVTFPSKVPEILTLAALIVSLLLTSWMRRVLPVALGADASLFVGLVGYLLTPFMVVGGLVWARADGIRRQADPWFDVLGLKAQLRRLQLAALIAFVIAFDHVTTIAQWATTRIGAS